MRGSVNYQINNIFKESGIFQPGTSRHDEKQSVKSDLKSQGKSAASQSVASRSAIHSYNSAQDYKDTWHKFGHYCRQELGLKDMSKADNKHVQSYLESRINDKIGQGTWKKEAAHLNKYAQALERFDSQPRNFQQTINDLRPLAKDNIDPSSKDHGGFNNPKSVVSALDSKNPNHGLAARVQLESGARLREASLIRKDQLQGIEKDRFTGRDVGKIRLEDTKGGKPRDVYVSRETYTKLEQATKNQAFQVNRNTYRNNVREAARAVGEKLTGTHNLRYCYAQERFNQIVESGHSTEQALQSVSWEMGHERADITNLYLR